MLVGMPIDHRYHRDERLIIRVAVLLGIIVGILTFTLAHQLRPPVRQVTPQEVWAYIEQIAPRAGLDPEFVYAIAWAESSLNEAARSSAARGMMQMTRVAWREVSDESYSMAWQWQTNVRVAIDYLAFCRDFLQARSAYSYPLLAACYRYGPYYVQDQDFEIGNLRKPDNEIYRRIFGGDVRPVLPPQTQLPRQ